MVQSKEIEITIGDGGEIEVEAIGYKGKGCSEDIKALLDGVGKTIDVKKKKSYYDEQQLHVNQQ